MCNMISRKVVVDSLDPRAHTIGNQVLPCESAGIFVGRIKKTADVFKDIRFVLVHLDAEKF